MPMASFPLKKSNFSLHQLFFASDVVDAPSLYGNPRINRHFSSITTQYYSIIMLMASFPFKNSNFSLHHLFCHLMLWMRHHKKANQEGTDTSQA